MFTADSNAVRLVGQNPWRDRMYDPIEANRIPLMTLNLIHI